MRFLGLSEAAPRPSARAQGSSDHRAADRVFAAGTRDAEARSCRRAASSASASSPYAPLGRGFLGRRDPAHRRARRRTTGGAHPRFQGENLAAQPSSLSRAVERDARHAKGCTPAQLALAWLLAHGPGHRADPGRAGAGHLEAHLRQLGVRALAARHRASARCSTAGRPSAKRTRYPAERGSRSSGLSPGPRLRVPRFRRGGSSPAADRRRSPPRASSRPRRRGSCAGSRR